MLFTQKEKELQNNTQNQQNQFYYPNMKISKVKFHSKQFVPYRSDKKQKAKTQVIITQSQYPSNNEFSKCPNIKQNEINNLKNQKQISQSQIFSKQLLSFQQNNLTVKNLSHIEKKKNQSQQKSQRIMSANFDNLNGDIQNQEQSKLNGMKVLKCSFSSEKLKTKFQNKNEFQRQNNEDIQQNIGNKNQTLQQQQILNSNRIYLVKQKEQEIKTFAIQTQGNNFAHIKQKSITNTPLQLQKYNKNSFTKTIANAKLIEETIRQNILSKTQLVQINTKKQDDTVQKNNKIIHIVQLQNVDQLPQIKQENDERVNKLLQTTLSSFFYQKSDKKKLLQSDRAKKLNLIKKINKQFGNEQMDSQNQNIIVQSQISSPRVMQQRQFFQKLNKNQCKFQLAMNGNWVHNMILCQKIQTDQLFSPKKEQQMQQQQYQNSTQNKTKQDKQKQMEYRNQMLQHYIFNFTLPEKLLNQSTHYNYVYKNNSKYHLLQQINNLFFVAELQQTFHQQNSQNNQFVAIIHFDGVIGTCQKNYFFENEYFSSPTLQTNNRIQTEQNSMKNNENFEKSYQFRVQLKQFLKHLSQYFKIVLIFPYMDVNTDQIMKYLQRQNYPIDAIYYIKNNIKNEIITKFPSNLFTSQNNINFQECSPLLNGSKSLKYVSQKIKIEEQQWIINYEQIIDDLQLKNFKKIIIINSFDFNLDSNMIQVKSNYNDQLKSHDEFILPRFVQIDTSLCELFQKKFAHLGVDKQFFNAIFVQNMRLIKNKSKLSTTTMYNALLSICHGLISDMNHQKNTLNNYSFNLFNIDFKMMKDEFKSAQCQALSKFNFQKQIQEVLQKQKNNIQSIQNNYIYDLSFTEARDNLYNFFESRGLKNSFQSFYGTIGDFCSRNYKYYKRFHFLYGTSLPSSINQSLKQLSDAYNENSKREIFINENEDVSKIITQTYSNYLLYIEQGINF